MPALFVFLLKVNIALILFCAGYYAVLRHLTFYTLNRVYLVAAILFATVYPQINLDSFVQQHQQIGQPVQVVLNLETPAQTLIQPIAKPDNWYWVEVVFWIGAGLLAIRLLVQLYSLYKLYRASTPANIGDHEVRLIDSDSGPFSFWKSIYVNPAKHNPADLKAILSHEQVHVNQWHTLDILLAELSTIFYWFNPGVWLMKKAVRENIEFITDRKVLDKGFDTKQYQYSLLNVIFPASPQGLVSNFNLSTIKKRIMMMNAKRSSKITLTRYALLTPIVVALLLIFSVSKAELKSAAKNSTHLFLKGLNIAVGDLPFVDKAPTHKKAATPKKGSAVISKADTAHAAIAIDDTTKRMKLMEMPIYIDGVRSTKEALSALEPGKMSRMVICHDENMKADDPEKRGYISVVTKGNENSEAVKALNAKMSKQFNTLSGTINIMNLAPGGVKAMRLNGVDIYGKTVDLNQLTRNSATGLTFTKGDKQDKVVINGDTIYGTRISALTLNKATLGRDSLYGVTTIMRGGGRRLNTSRDSLLNRMRGYTVNSDAKVYRLGGGGTYKLDTVKVDGHMAYTIGRRDDAVVVNGKPMIARATVSPRYYLSNTPINFTDRLIIIDGNEATQKELKKLSVDKIQSISNMEPEAAKTKYGDKGKNGAVLVTTKK